MSEVKDPRIKLFGKTIELPETSSAAVAGGASSAQPFDAAGVDCENQDPSSSSDSMLEDVEDQESEKSLSGPKQTVSEDKHQAQLVTPEEIKASNVTPPTNEDSTATTTNGQTGETKNPKNEEDQSDDKTLKKPDKIVPCPRCNSMDTKFCYFNNYNVNQPRHFCKNCQRYWTAGGTMRNVPVGAGRRKNKNVVASQFRHITVPEALHGLPNVILHPGVNPNGTVLTFSSDTPLCESMASVLNIADKSRNGFHQTEGVKKGDDHSSGSSVTASSSKDEVGKTQFPDPIPNYNPFHPQVPVFHAGPLPYPWNAVPWTPPNFGGPSTFPPPFPYWGCAVTGTWNIPWIIPSAPTASSSGPNSPTLGKHSRDDGVSKEEAKQKESNPEKCLWAPKTLRIDDPGEAAKSSIWATLGIKNDERVDSFGGHGLFKAFRRQSKGDEKTEALETSEVLKANPAAFSRSLSFRESS